MLNPATHYPKPFINLEFFCFPEHRPGIFLVTSIAHAIRINIPPIFLCFLYFWINRLLIFLRITRLTPMSGPTTTSNLVRLGSGPTGGPTNRRSALLNWGITTLRHVNLERVLGHWT